MSSITPVGFLPPFEPTSNSVTFQIGAFQDTTVGWNIHDSALVDLVAYRIINPSGGTDQGTTIASSQPAQSNYTWTPASTSAEIANAGDATYFLSLIGSLNSSTNSSFFDVVQAAVNTSATASASATTSTIASTSASDATASASGAAVSNVNVGAVIGGSIAASLCFFFVFAALFYLYHHRKRRNLGAQKEADLVSTSTDSLSPISTINEKRWPVKDKDAPLPALPQEKDAGYVGNGNNSRILHEMDSAHVAELPP